MSKFQQHMVGIASFGNKSQFQIDMVKPDGSCRITDLNNSATSYAGSVAKAWSSVRYQGGVRPDTGNTHGWPKNNGIYSKAYN